MLTRNPFNANQIKRVSLNPKDVEAIVFWTRDPSKLMRHLPELDDLGHRYYFQYTLTGYPRSIEGAVPKPQAALKRFSELSDMIGADKVVWRYDPILLSNTLPLAEHKRLFSKIASHLAGKTNSVVISFADFYRKTERGLNAVEGLVYSDITEHREQLLALSEYMADIAGKYEMQITSCAEAVDTRSAGIAPGKCIDEQLIRDVFGIELSGKKDQGQREACGCIKSIDIGMYNTCLHGCCYCYATFNNSSVINNKRNHDVNSPLLVGGVADADPALLANNEVQAGLF